MDARGGGLTRRIAIAGGLLTLALVAGFMSVLFAIRHLDRSTQSRSHSRQELLDATALQTLVIDLETGLRGFVIARDERFLAPYEQARAAFPRRAAALERLVAGEPAQLARVRQIARRVRSYVADYSLPLIDAVRRQRPSARNVATTAEGTVRIDAIRADFDAIRSAASTVLDARAGSAGGAERVAIVGAAVGAVGSILLVLLFVGFLARIFVKPVRRAALLADRVASGDLSVRMAESGVGEIGTLERSFNLMTDSLEQDRKQLARLAGEQAALRRVATLVAHAAPADELFAAVVEEVGHVFSAAMAAMGRYGADGTVRIVAGWNVSGELTFDALGAHVAQTRRPVRTDDPGDSSAVGTPISVDDDLWGIMVVCSSKEQPLAPDTEARLANFTDLVATAVANAQGRADLAASRARIVVTADATRRRIERDLHDGAQQRLVTLALQLRAAQAAVPPELSDLGNELARTVDGLTSALDDLREIARGIHPAILAEGGLGPALKTLARRSPIPVELDLRTDARLPEAVEVAAYYVVSETLTNAAKHAHASMVHVDVEAVNGGVRVRVRDDGDGGADPAGGSGLLGLMDRVDALGGTMSVDSPPGAGTSLEVELPLPHRE
jgi:signal transduction histidine kinase